MSAYTHEEILSKLGLFGSEWSPTFRALTAFGAVTVVIFLVQPSWAFTPDGKTRPWSKSYQNQSGEGTAVPWWYPGLVAAAVAGLIV